MKYDVHCYWYSGDSWADQSFSQLVADAKSTRRQLEDGWNLLKHRESVAGVDTGQLTLESEYNKLVNDFLDLPLSDIGIGVWEKGPAMQKLAAWLASACPFTSQKLWSWVHKYPEGQNEDAAVKPPPVPGATGGSTGSSTAKTLGLIALVGAAGYLAYRSFRSSKSSSSSPKLSSGGRSKSVAKRGKPLPISRSLR